MKLKIKYAIIALIGISALHLLISYLSFEFDPSKWHWAARMFEIALAVIIAVFAIIDYRSEVKNG